MHAITVNEYGAAPALTDVPDPQPGPGQVLIRIEAAGMNPMDRTIADGGWKAMMPATFPLILGSDLAGVVEAVGEGASRFSKGDEVFGQLFIAPLGSTGTYAEYVAVAEDASRPRAEGLGPEVAAALPTSGATALEIVESLEPLDGKTCS
jgi:NADPH2:quinone reductase